jgi:hypothetical protein
MLRLEGLSKSVYSQYDALFSSKLFFANHTPADIWPAAMRQTCTSNGLVVIRSGLRLP